MAGSSSGMTLGSVTPAVTLAGTTDDSEKNAEFQEIEQILSPDFLPADQITNLLREHNVDIIQEKMRAFLNFQNIHICLKDAILLDYYVSGFFWAKGMDFTIDQCSKFMTLLDMLLHNLQTLHMSLEDSIKWLGEVMAEIGPNHSQKNEELHIFDVRESKAIIDYLKISLFQHYRLYEFMFYSNREEIVIGMEQTIELVKPADLPFPAPLEEGISVDIYATFMAPSPPLESELKELDQEQGSQESLLETERAKMDPLAGFTIDDVKSALARVTDEVLMNIQNEISEKLQVQEEAFNARIEKLKKT
ncbi:ciliary-associated calcium-binding coiled-coil protein 1 isoform X1 [Meriones unguiculatus]|uniref:ciliary-associated calcium-binding coiled-coil protein 1 isoform X1 n=1 Tax=Meriones unguiculatus TaxID=10047 RepID=UPI00293E9C7F|nr:ciliary-associated calcium-binding coiled-coil protein 1 isoform X1 [Meriones unguiculatus]